MTKRFFKISAQGLQHWKLALAMSFMCAAAAHAQSNKDGTTATASAVNIEAYGELFASSKPVSSQLSKVFFYRPTSVLAPQPVNIYLDGHYHTSLLRGGFAETCIVPGAMAVQSVLDDASRQHTGKQEAGQRIQFDAGDKCANGPLDRCPECHAMCKDGHRAWCEIGTLLKEIEP